MKKYVLSFLVLLSFLLITSCDNTIFSRGDVWVLDSENGKLQVSVSFRDFNANYIIRAIPDQGYELVDTNIYIYQLMGNDLSSYTIGGIKEIDKNLFAFTTDKDRNLVISACFTKKETE